ncbi:histidine kinase [Microbacterium horticulturae]|uniref:histidine kinase n=1 Tax=Microbacterium horticulturae TaxID=3028316 RepID=A0ABY8C1A6_9MICO|nr:histidine kinase [Microbacterium sp. KACC 23027]WEG10236.1 histidine kinase [Microbacterium sp. KACC 23027]
MKRMRIPGLPLPRSLRSGRAVTYLVLGITAVALYPVLVPVHVAVYGANAAIAMLLGLFAVGAPLVGVRRPTVAIVLFTASAALFPLASLGVTPVTAPWPWSVPMLIAFAVCTASLTFLHGWRTGLILIAFGVAAGMIASAIEPSIASANDIITTVAIVAGLYVIAALLAGRLRLGDELSSQRALTAQEQTRRELVEERTRIARELHDVVAHSMSLIQVQASTARYRVPDLPERALAEFEGIAATARTSLTEMRRILGVLRTEDQTAELAPQRGIDDIPALVETTRRAGAEVGLVQAVSDEIAPAAQIAAYRIVQEALSNAVRHAPGAAISVYVTTDAADLTLRVHNAPSDHPSGTPGGGHGLRGMGERAQLLGGSVEAGADADGGWTVVAHLPTAPPTDPSEATL